MPTRSCSERLFFFQSSILPSGDLEQQSWSQVVLACIDHEVSEHTPGQYRRLIAAVQLKEYYMRVVAPLTFNEQCLPMRPEPELLSG